MKHSASPWLVCDPHIATGSFSGTSLKSIVTGKTLAIVLDGPDAKENGRLMAAAPELAAALEQLLWQCRQMEGMFPDDDGTIATAIEDAENALMGAK
jgi:hypothetical protein